MIGFGLLLLVGCQAPAPEPKATPVPVQTLQVRREPGHEVHRGFAGTIRSRRESQLGFERPGTVVELHVEEGDVVRPGQVLARLDTAQLQVRQRQLRAALEEARARVGLSELTTERLDALAADQYASAQSRDEARFGLAAARAVADRIQAQLDALQVDLRKSRLVAPFSGTVATRLVDEGTVVAAGTPVVRFLESQGYEAVIGVPVGLARDLEVGSEHRLLADGLPIPAVLESKVDDVDSRTRTRQLVFRIESSDRIDGEIVNLELARWVDEPGFWIPLDALTEGVKGTWSVYRVLERAEGAVVSREAVHVLDARTERLFVRGTLEDGDRIVSTGLHRVVPGQVVEPLTPVEPQGMSEAAP